MDRLAAIEEKLSDLARHLDDMDARLSKHIVDVAASVNALHGVSIVDNIEEWSAGDVATLLKRGQDH